jgi:DNA invertase Pin-like site-specific DNA recombinase
MGKAFLRILLVFAELERDRISESWKTATYNAIDRGVHALSSRVSADAALSR